MQSATNRDIPPSFINQINTYIDSCSLANPQGNKFLLHGIKISYNQLTDDNKKKTHDYLLNRACVHIANKPSTKLVTKVATAATAGVIGGGLLGYATKLSIFASSLGGCFFAGYLSYATSQPQDAEGIQEQRKKEVMLSIKRRATTDVQVALGFTETPFVKLTSELSNLSAATYNNHYNNRTRHRR